MKADADRERTRAIRNLTGRLWLFALGSLGFGFSLVPLYNVICDVTGYGDRAQLEAASTAREAPVAGRTITIEFMSALPTVGAWQFSPVKESMQIQLGKFYEARFDAKNMRNSPAVAQAVPSIAPSSATRYLHKAECFCFRPQSFAPNEERELVVRFLIDKDLPVTVDRVTLAYSLYDTVQSS